MDFTSAILMLTIPLPGPSLDFTSIISMYAAAAAGFLSMSKGLEALANRKKKTQENGNGPQTLLFPNGERDEIVRAITDLRRDSRHKYDQIKDMEMEFRDLAARLDKVADHLKISL